MNVSESDSLNQPDELSKQTAREWATKLQTAYNWAEVLTQVSKLRADFRTEVWGFWQLSVFGETDNINFLNVCYRCFSCSPLIHGGWGGRSVASKKQIDISAIRQNSHVCGCERMHKSPTYGVHSDADATSAFFSLVF